MYALAGERENGASGTEEKEEDEEEEKDGEKEIHVVAQRRRYILDAWRIDMQQTAYAGHAGANNTTNR